MAEVSRSQRHLIILMTLSCVVILSYTSWFQMKQNTRESGKTLKNVDKNRNDVYGGMYRSFKPDTCLRRILKPHCFGRDVNYLNQSMDLDLACFPEEVVFKDIGLDDPNLLPKSFPMMPMEKETVNDPEYVDMLNTVSLNKSQIILEDPNRRHQIGDIIKVRVDLVNNSGKRRTVGGDDVRALMVSRDQVFRISGDVTDLNNGSYQVKFQALREGHNTVNIIIPYTREMRATMFKWFRRHKALYYYSGLFQLNDIQEYTLCSPYKTIPGFKAVCNFTALNDDLPWFCGRPVNRKLHCDTLISFERLDYTEILANDAQYSAFYRPHLMSILTSKLSLYVIKGKHPKIPNTINCNRIKPRDTWNTTIPTGYLYKQKWIQLNCKNTVTIKTVASCLVNTTLFLTGDSTVHPWLNEISEIIKLTLIRIKWAILTWTDDGMYISKHLNTTIRWAPPVLPFVRARILPDGKMNLKSISTHLKQLPSSGRIIFVIHLYAHFTRHHYSLFWFHIRSLKPAIRDALKRNKDLKLAIKSPHMFYRSPCITALNDLQAPIFIDIIKQEFDEFKDSMIYLNYWEINHVHSNDLVHPLHSIVWDNIRHLLGYVC